MALLPLKKSPKIMEKTSLIHIKVVKVFEYRKNNNNYWNKANLPQQVVNKVLSIARTLYSSYSLLIFFDNATSYSFYTKIYFMSKIWIKV